jgi:hypothetical protein
VLARMFAATMEGWMNAERCMLLLNVLQCPWMFLNVSDALGCSDVLTGSESESSFIVFGRTP